MTICFEGYFRTVMCIHTVKTDYSANQQQRPEKKYKSGSFFATNYCSNSVLFVAVFLILTTMEKYSLNSCGKLNF